MTDPTAMFGTTAMKWRVRFEKPDGMFTFVDIGWPNEPTPYFEACLWAEEQTILHPNKYKRVAVIYNLDEE